MISPGDFSLVLDGRGALVLGRDYPVPLLGKCIVSQARGTSTMVVVSKGILHWISSRK